MSRKNGASAEESPLSGSSLALTVQLENGEAQRVRFLRADTRGCTFAYPDNTSMVIPLGTMASLVFQSPDFDPPWQTTAKVVFRDEHSSGRRYSVRFGTLTQMPPPLYALATNRSAYRVQPAHNEHIPVLVHTNGGPNDNDSIAGEMKDISIRGIGISLALEAEAKLADLTTLYVEIKLTGSADSVNVVGRIMNRSLSQDKTTYGLEFDRELTPEFSVQEYRIREYVSNRLSYELKRSEEADTRLGTFL